MAAMCGRCTRKLQHLRAPWHLPVRSLCVAPSNSPSYEVDKDLLSGIQSSVAKKRDPLAVLKALASTVKPTPHLPNIEFIEDVYLFPRSRAKQEACLTAKQSGREAAEFVIKICPGIFPLREPNPMWISEESIEVADVKTEKDLKYFIKVEDARSAVLAYERLTEQGVKVSLDTKNELLDLAGQQLGHVSAKCVLNPEGTENNKEVEVVKMASYEEDVNEADSDLSDQEDENITTTKAAQDKLIVPGWRDDNYALQMFHSMKTKNGTTYETMVLGFLKYRCYLDAYNLFKEMRQLGYQASLFTYNLLFKAVSKSLFINAKWEAAKELVKNMSEEPVVIPDLKTYNAVMKVAVVSSEEDKSQIDLTLGIFRDMIAAGLEPTLESYNQLLRAGYLQHWEEKKKRRETANFRRKIDSVSPVILNKVITHLESLPKFPPLKDPEDAFFFRTAMSAALLCKDVKLAIRIYNLFEKLNNTSYLGQKQGPFYSSFLLTLTTADVNFSVIYKYYQEIVPLKFRPREHIYTSLFNMASRTNNTGLVKRFYLDMRKHGVQLTTTVAVAMFRALCVVSDPKSSFVAQYPDTTNNKVIKRNFQQHQEENLNMMLDVLRWMKMYRVEITHVIITHLIRMYCLNDQLENAWEALNMFQENRIPIPTYTALNDILLKACKKNDSFKVLRIFEMMAKYGYNLNKVRRYQLYDICGLPFSERRRIDVLFSDMAILDQRRRQYYSDKKDEKSQQFDL